MLYLIGLGLGNEYDISYRGLKIVKKAKKIYLENYTSKMACSKEDLEKFYGRGIIEVDRNFVENEIESLFEDSKKHEIAFLVIGDIYSASTHIDLYLRAKKQNIPIQIITGVSILTAIGVTGLSLYNFGRVTSIPFNNENIKSPYEAYLINQKSNLHTLFLLDLNPKDNKFLSIKEACKYITEQGENKDTLAIGCARLGFENFKIKTGTLETLQQTDFGKPPYCLIVPAEKLHFIEEEALELWR